MASFLGGLVRQYVRRHGVDALLPHRKEPLERWHVRAMFGLADGTPVNGEPLRWASAPFVAQRALVAALCETGARKADLLPESADSFAGDSVARSNITFMIGGKFVRDPTREQLQSMRPGDRVLLRPGATKADFDGSAFGDKDVPLACAPGLYGSSNAPEGESPWKK